MYFFLTVNHRLAQTLWSSAVRVQKWLTSCGVLRLLFADRQLLTLLPFLFLFITESHWVVWLSEVCKATNYNRTRKTIQHVNVYCFQKRCMEFCHNFETKEFLRLFFFVHVSTHNFLSFFIFCHHFYFYLCWPNRTWTIVFLEIIVFEQ